MVKKYKIESSSLEEVLNKLEKSTIVKQPFIKPDGVFFLGKINDKSFKLITFNSPPAELHFLIKENSIEIDYRKDDFTKTFSILIYVLLFPIFIIFWLISLISEKYGNTETIILSVALILPILLKKAVVYLYKKYLLANDAKIKLLLENTLDVELVEIYS